MGSLQESQRPTNNDQPHDNSERYFPDAIRSLALHFARPAVDDKSVGFLLVAERRRPNRQ